MPAFKCIPYADSLIAAADIVYLEMVCLNDTIVFERHRAMQEAIERGEQLPPTPPMDKPTLEIPMRLEVHFHHKFKYSRIKRPRDRAESRVAETGVGSHQRWRVRNVESFRAELRLNLFLDRKCFSQHDVECAVRRPNNGIA